MQQRQLWKKNAVVNARNLTAVSPVHPVMEIFPQFLEENVGDKGSLPLNHQV